MTTDTQTQITPQSETEIQTRIAADSHADSSSQTASQAPTTPLRWSPAKRPVTVERDSLHRKVLGSPAPLRAGRSIHLDKENDIRLSHRALAPAPPLLPMAPPLLPTKRLHPAVCRAHADRLRIRLKVAYFKVKTRQEDRSLNELSVNTLYCN